MRECPGSSEICRRISSSFRRSSRRRVCRDHPPSLPVTDAALVSVPGDRTQASPPFVYDDLRLMVLMLSGGCPFSVQDTQNFIDSSRRNPKAS